MFKNKKILSWALYDWANSSFSTTVMAGFFPVFFKTYWSQGVSAVDTTSRLGTAISFSSFVIALVTPILGAMSDLRETKKIFLVLFMLVGTICCAWLGFIGTGQWPMAILAYGLAMMAFNASSVFYDSLLPSLGNEKDLDYASSLGFSLGYLGGGVLFLINVLMYLFPAKFGLASGVEGVQYSFVSVALWWFLFTFPLILNVPEPKSGVSPDRLSSLLSQTHRQLKKTMKELFNHKNLFLFVVAYWLYIDGVYTVMTMAVDYGISIGFKSEHLIVALLLTQFVGFPATLLFGHVTKNLGCRKPILVCLIIYSISVILASQMTDVWHFYALACVIGLVQGGVQSLSRSLFAKMIPANKSGEYFGFFNLVGKFASILGPLVVAASVQITQKSNYGLMGLVVLFGLGGYLLMNVNENQRA